MFGKHAHANKRERGKCRFRKVRLLKSSGAHTVRGCTEAQFDKNLTSLSTSFGVHFILILTLSSFTFTEAFETTRFGWRPNKNRQQQKQWLWKNRRWLIDRVIKITICCWQCHHLSVKKQSTWRMFRSV